MAQTRMQLEQRWNQKEREQRGQLGWQERKERLKKPRKQFCVRRPNTVSDMP
jgi:hypothetical protein